VTYLFLLFILSSSSLVSINVYSGISPEVYVDADVCAGSAEDEASGEFGL